MIIVKLQGGLGNQMFQFAIAKKIEIKTGEKVYFDKSFKQAFGDTPRQYALEPYNASNSIINADISRLPLIFRHPEAHLVNYILNYFRISNLFYKDWQLITEKEFQLENINYNWQSNIFLKGYWQSEKYFMDIRTILLEDFTLKTPSKSFESVAHQITSYNSAGVHVRHGDYITNDKTNAFHGVCSPEYYKHALEVMQVRLPNIKLYIFTDDIDWAKDHFLQVGLKFELVSGKGFSDQEELLLMSKCRHQIIANSSYSWWGAWLNSYPEKLVIAPKKWFANEEQNHQTQDLIPHNWIRL